MSDDKKFVSQHAKVGLTVSQNSVLVSIQVELYDDVLLQLKTDVLDLIQQRNLSGLLLDMSQVQVLDYAMALQLSELTKMASLLGARTVLTGIQPGVAVSVSDWIDVWQGVQTSRHLDDGLLALQRA